MSYNPLAKALLFSLSKDASLQKTPLEGGVFAVWTFDGILAAAQTACHDTEFASDLPKVERWISRH